MRNRLKSTLLAGALVPLGACVSHTYAPGPGMSAESFGAQSAQCHLFADGTTPSYEFGASGSPKVVAVAMAAEALGTGIASAIRTNRNYDYCMQARGWRVAYGAPPRIASAQASGGGGVLSSDQPQSSKGDGSAAPRQLNTEPVADLPDVGHLTYRAVDQLLAAFPGVEPGASVAVAPIARAERPAETSQFGLIVADLTRGRLVQHGISVVEPPASSPTRLGRSRPERGSGIPRQLVRLPGASNLVTGTYAVGGSKIYVSLKLVSTTEGRIISAVDYAVPRYPDANSLLPREEMALR